jgi:hypothetical protein
MLEGIVMATLDEEQQQAANTLITFLRKAKPGEPVLAQVTGAVGAGKSTIMRIVAAEVRLIGKIPVLIEDIAGEIDSGPMALLSAVDQLEKENVERTDWSILDDPSQPWSSKLAFVKNKIDRHGDSLVLICDEPMNWYRGGRPRANDTPDEYARQFAEWIAGEARCHRVLSGLLPEGVQPVTSLIRAPRIENALAYWRDADSWNGLTGHANKLSEAAAWPLERRSVWEVRLCVALSVFLPVQAVISLAAKSTSAKTLADTLLDHLEKDPAHKHLREGLARLAVSRDLLDREMVRELLVGTSTVERAVVEDVLMEWRLQRGRLHPLVRQAIINRPHDHSRPASKACWSLQSQDLRKVHRRLADEYLRRSVATRLEQLEAFHHQSLCSELPVPQADARLRFVEQLHEIGWSLSYVFREHKPAAEYFRFAVSLDETRAYSHHYLAFNLDWMATETQTVEQSYLRAIELQPTHPWWWSRWISYLATRGEYRRARDEWQRSRDALSIGDSTSDWMFLSLHRWVARWLLHWGQLDFAEEVLREIPQELAHRDLSILALQDLLVALWHAKRGVCVFPLTVPAREWRSSSHHTDLPPVVGGESLSQWFPARVESIDEELGEVRLAVGRWPKSSDDEFASEDQLFTRDEVSSAACGFGWAELAAGRFVELGYYGLAGQMRLALHPETEWRDSNLLRLVPPPSRWFKRAVDEAWSSLGEQKR